MHYGFQDAALEQQFARDGYVVLTLLSDEEVAEARAWAADSMPADAQINDPQGALYLSIFDERGAIELPPALRDTVAQRLAQIFGGRRMVGGCLIAKLAGSERLDIHQHQPQSPDIHDAIVNVWITLDDVADGTGAITLVPRSHRIVRHIQSFSSPPYFHAFQDAVESRHKIVLPMTAGQVLLFDNSLLHGSTHARDSADHRLRLHAMMFPAETPLCILTEEDGRFAVWNVDGQTVDPGLFCMADELTDSYAPMGTIDNRNERLTEAEFVELLHSGEKIAPGYDPIDAIRAARTRPTLKRSWERLRAMLRPGVPA